MSQGGKCKPSYCCFFILCKSTITFLICYIHVNKKLLMKPKHSQLPFWDIFYKSAYLLWNEQCTCSFCFRACMFLHIIIIRQAWIYKNSRTILITHQGHISFFHKCGKVWKTANDFKTKLWKSKLIQLTCSNQFQQLLKETYLLEGLTL